MYLIITKNIFYNQMEILRIVMDYMMLYFEKFDYYNTVISNLPPNKNKIILMPNWNSSIIKQYEELNTKNDCIIKFHAPNYFVHIINIYN